MIVEIDGQMVKYEPFKDEMYFDDMRELLETNQSMRKVFKRNLTERFIGRLKSLTDVSATGFNRNTIISIHGQTGCQPNNSKVLMSNGQFKNIQDIQVGDSVISFDTEMNSIFSKVVKKVSWSCSENYDVFQTKRHQKKLYSCSYNHIIPFNRRKSYRILNENKRNIEWVIDELPARTFYTFSKNRLEHNIMGISCPPIKSFDNSKEDCEIEPYLLGVFISDGSFACGIKEDGTKAYWLNITNNDDEVMNYVCSVYPPQRIRKKYGTTCKTYSWLVRSELGIILDKYGYNMVKSGKKFIPEQALKSSIEYRVKLLAGLIDGDGYFKNGNYTFCQKSYKLVKDIEYLVWSVGGFVNQIKRKKGTIKSRNFVGDYWHICFRISENLNLPLLTERRKPTKKTYLLSTNRQSIYLKKINKTRLVHGFTLDSPTGYYITDNWMLTHNSGKSMTMFSLGIRYFPHFSHENMFFFDEVILKTAHKFKEHEMIVRDENPAKAIFGQGSTRVSGQFGLLAETCRKSSLNLAMIEPSFEKNDITKVYLHLIDQDLKNRINRCGLIHPTTLRYQGAVLIPIIAEDHPEWVKYQEIKDDFIEKMKRGDFSGSKLSYKDIARECINDSDFERYKSKVEKKAYLLNKFPNYTTGEIETILAMVNVIKREGDDVNPTQESNHKKVEGKNEYQDEMDIVDQEYQEQMDELIKKTRKNESQ